MMTAKPVRIKSSSARTERLNTVYGLIKVLVGIIVCLPLLYGLSASFMSYADLQKVRVIPREFSLQHYKEALSTFPVFQYAINTMITVALSLVFQVITSCMAAYALVFFKWKLKGLCFLLIQMSMMIPGEAVIIANYLTVMNMGLIDTYLGISITALISSMGIFMLRQYFYTVPTELRDAANIDGCTKMQFLTRVLMPISLPTISSLVVYLFVVNYNRYLWPMLVTSTSAKRTIQVGVAIIISGEATNMGLLSATAVAALLIPIAVFTICHKYLVKGMTAGAIKG